MTRLQHRFLKKSHCTSECSELWLEGRVILITVNKDIGLLTNKQGPTIEGSGNGVWLGEALRECISHLNPGGQRTQEIPCSPVKR